MMKGLLLTNAERIVYYVRVLNWVRSGKRRHLRNQLLAEIAALGAHGISLRAWPKANTLTPADGGEVRLAFQARFGGLQTIKDEDP